MPSGSLARSLGSSSPSDLASIASGVSPRDRRTSLPTRSDRSLGAQQNQERCPAAAWPDHSGRHHPPIWLRSLRAFHRVIEGHRYPPEAIEAWVLNKIKSDAQRQLGPITRVVITLRSGFDRFGRFTA